MPIRLDEYTELIRVGWEPSTDPLSRFVDFDGAKFWLQHFRPDSRAMLKLRSVLALYSPSLGSLTDSEVIDRLAWQLAEGKFLLKRHDTQSPLPRTKLARQKPVTYLRPVCDEAYGLTYDCNVLVWRVLKEFVNPKEPQRDANELIVYLEKQASKMGSGWKQVPISKCQDLANRNVVVVGGATEKGQGHVVVIYPGSEKPDGGFRIERDGKTEVAPKHGIYPRCVSRSRTSSWPGTNSSGDKTVRDAWSDEAFKRVKFWAYQAGVIEEEETAPAKVPEMPALFKVSNKGGKKEPGVDPNHDPGFADDDGGGGNKGKKGEKKKHWIGVKVVDEEGKPVKDVAVSCKLSDGTILSVDFSSATLAKDGSFKTEEVLDATSGEFTFPALFDVEWWPQGSTAPKATSVAPTPAAGDGDCVISIADALTFRNYHSVWDQDQNAAFKKDRPNPNMLAKGDVLQAPDKKDKAVKKAVDQTWTFVVKDRKPFKLRLVLIDKDDKPLTGKAWELKTPLAQKGTTGGDGLLEITGLKPGDKAGTLEVTMHAAATPPAPPPAPGPVPSPPPYPPAIVEKDFKDKRPAPDFKAKVAHWDLSIGGLPAVKVKEGSLARLHNLGFGCDVDSDDAHAKRAVQAYQRLYLKDKNGSGKPADIQDDAAKRHDQ